MKTQYALLETELSGVKLFRKGKVRDVYEIDDALLIVTTDRISAFDCVLPEGLPDKGKILTEISLFWFRFFENEYPHHLITKDFNKYPSCLSSYQRQLEGRSVLVKKAKPFPIECIVRGYLTGSAWKEYQKCGTICGITLPKGLQKEERLPEPLFTPSTKAIEGHDENISFEKCQEMIGKDLSMDLKKRSIDVYKKAFDYAKKRGIIICDTKFEFGSYNDNIIFIDELLTPDSSRFWKSEYYRLGQNNESFDKQIVRDYLEKTDWNKEYPAPHLPQNIIDSTLERYRDIVDRLKS